MHSLNGTVNRLENHILLQHLRNTTSRTLSHCFSCGSFAPELTAGETTACETQRAGAAQAKWPANSSQRQNPNSAPSHFSLLPPKETCLKPCFKLSLPIQGLWMEKKVTVTSTEVQQSLQNDQGQSFITMQQPGIFSLLQGAFEIPLQSPAYPKLNSFCSHCPATEQIHSCECHTPSQNLVAFRVHWLWVCIFTCFFS